MIAIAALAGALTVAGVLGILTGLRPVPEPGPGHRRVRRGARSAALARLSRRTRMQLLAGLLAGAVAAVWTGWLLAVLIGPVVAAGVPAEQIARLEALEEWVRSLSTVLRAGVGMEQAIMATAHTVPDPIRPEVTRLTARLHARWPTTEALRAFAVEFGDATGDLVAVELILGSVLRAHGLSAALEALAGDVAADVRGRRAVEADRATPRATARMVTITTLTVLGVLALTGDYIEPYTTMPGMLLFALLLAAYVGCLIWMRRLTIPAPLPRLGRRRDRPGGLASGAGPARPGRRAGPVGPARPHQPDRRHHRRRWA